MLKNYVILIALMIGGFSSVKAQCTPVANNNAGIYPDTVLTTGCVDAPYLDTFTMVLPYDTVISGFTILVDSGKVLNYINVPAGLTFSCGANCTGYPTPPSTPGKVCTMVSGSSSVRLVNYRVGIVGQAWVTVPFVGVQTFVDTFYVYLSIDSIDNSVSVSAPTITANETGASYRWLDCGSSYAFISGETGQSFTATTTGSYAVEITKGNCVDTSACENITTTDIASVDFANHFNVYPNPSNDGLVNIAVAGLYNNFLIEVLDVTGKLVKKQMTNNNTLIELNLGNNKGAYQIRISDNKGQQTTKLLLVK